MILNKWSGPVFLFFAFSLAGTSVIAVRFVSGMLGPFTIAAASLGFALLVLLPLCGKRLAGLRGMPLKRLLMAFLQGATGIFLFRMFLINGLVLTSSFEAGVVTGATPAITSVLAIVFLKEKVNLKILFGIACTVAGVFLIQGLLHSGTAFSAGHLGGNLLVLCAAASESVFNIMSRIMTRNATEDKQADPLLQTTLVVLIALLLCLVPTLSENPVQSLSCIGPEQWLSLAWYGVVVTAVAFICWYAGINRCGALSAAAFSGMMPCSSMILSVCVLGEAAGFEQYTGGVLVVAGMALIGTGNVTIKYQICRNIKILKRRC